MSDAGLKILIVDQSALRASVLEEGLREAGHMDVVILRDTHNLLRRIVDANPDVICIDLQNPNRDVLEQMFQVSKIVRRPVAMFVNQSDAMSMEAAIEAGVSAYVVDGLRKERVKAIVDLSISRFNAFNRLRQELDTTRRALDDRKLCDRAKGILMKQRRCNEEDAYALMRKTAMNENMRLGEVAQSIITAAALLR